MLTSEMISEYVDTLLSTDLPAFGPELVLCGTIVVMLLWKVFVPRRFSILTSLKGIAAAGTLLALWLACQQWANLNSDDPEIQKTFGEIFDGLLVYDGFTVFFRIFILVFTLLVILLTMLTGMPDEEDSADFYTLLLGAVIGMSMMASANNLLMVFLAVEMASVPSYAMAGFLKGRRQSSEAALKYVVFGGAAAGIMLYGLTLLGGIYGTLHLPTLADAIFSRLTEEGASSPDTTLMLALMLVLVGLAFKLSAFPFHFWCPDVFEGAAAEVAAFLSVASKGAAIALLARFTLALAGPFSGAPFAGDITNYLMPTLAVIAAVTCTFGNLAAYGQTNLKRLLAYSTIAHAGYMMLALATLTVEGVWAAIFYLILYLFMNLGAFAVVAFIRNETGSEELDAYRGLIHRAPVLTVAMSVFLLSLTGIPPMAGFIGKFRIFAVLYEFGKEVNTIGYVLLAIGGANTVISLFYYVNVMRVMILEGEPSEKASLENFMTRSYAGILAVAVVIMGILFEPLLNFSEQGASALKSGSRPSVVALSDENDTTALSRRANRP